MNLFVKVKPKARSERVEKIDNTHFCVYTKALAEKGKANEEVIRIIAEYFSVAKYQVHILSGKKSHIKIISLIV